MWDPQGKISQFVWAIPQRLKKVLITAQGCARLRTGLIIMEIPRGYHKKMFIAQKVCSFVSKVRNFILQKKPHLWPYSYRIWRNLVCGHFLWPGIRLKNLIPGLHATKVRRVKKAFKSLWDHPKKNSLLLQIAQRRRDMCDPQGKYPNLCSHSTVG